MLQIIYIFFWKKNEKMPTESINYWFFNKRTKEVNLSLIVINENELTHGPEKGLATSV
jgi:hypothetical protein